MRRLLTLILVVAIAIGLTGCGEALRAGPVAGQTTDELSGDQKDEVAAMLPLADGRPHPLSGLKLCVTTPLTITRVRFVQAAIEVVDAKLYDRKMVSGKNLPKYPETALLQGGRPAVGATIDRLCRDKKSDRVVELDVLLRQARGYAQGAYGPIVIEYVTNGQHHWGSLEYPLVIGYPTT